MNNWNDPIRPCVVGCGAPARPVTALQADLYSVINSQCTPYIRKYNVPIIEPMIYNDLFYTKSNLRPNINRIKRNKKKCKISKLSKRRNRNG